MTKLREIVPHLRAPGSDIDIRNIPSIRRKYPKVYASLLFACTKTQVRLLRALWLERFPSDELLRRALKKLIESGKFIDLLDINSANAVALIEQAYLAEHLP